MAQAHVLPALLAGRTLMLGRALPRFHNVMSTPTVPANALETMASSQMVGVRVPVMAYSPFFKRYFKEEHDVMAHDPEETVKCGDTIVIKKMEKPLNKNVLFQVQEVIYKLGDVIDPVSGEPVRRDQYRSRMKVEAGLYGKDLVPDGFDYDVAPPRGWQEGKKDFTDKVTYYKWHVFDDTDDYALIS